METACSPPRRPRRSRRRRRGRAHNALVAGGDVAVSGQAIAPATWCYRAHSSSAEDDQRLDAAELAHADGVTCRRRGRHVLRVDAGGHADFRTIGAAVDYAATHPAPEPERIGLPGGAWWIVVEPAAIGSAPSPCPPIPTSSAPASPPKRHLPARRGSQATVAGPPTLGNAAGLRVRQATGTGTSLLVTDSELVSTFGEPALAIDLEAVADARLAGVAVRGFLTHLSAAQGSAVSVARSELRLVTTDAVTTDAGSTVREAWPPAPAASSDPGYEGLVTVDGGHLYRHDGSQWVRAPLAFGLFGT